MECNREEAVRARGMAEQKLASQDYLSAKKYALKAQQLFPGLENMMHMMAVINVHVAALVKIGGSNEKDWYSILQVDPNADEAAVKKQYRKLALFLHPDKNKFAGAESAFKLIGEASQVLSDKMRRLVYNAKRGLAAHGRTSHHAPVRNPRGSGIHKQFHPQNGHGAPSTNVFTNSNKQNFTAARQQAQLHPFTFWTACPFCQMRYQYFRKFENQKLLCLHCRQPFVAKELSNLQRASATQAHPSQTAQTKSHASSTPGTAGSNGYANGCQNFPGAMASSYTKGSASVAKNGSDSDTNLPNGRKSTEKAEVEKGLRRKAEELITSMEQRELGNQKEHANGRKVTEKAEVKKDFQRKPEHLLRSVELQKELARQKEQAKNKASDCDTGLPNAGKVAGKVEELLKAEQFRRSMEPQELERQSEQSENIKVTEKDQEQSVKLKTEEQPEDTTAHLKKEQEERASSKSKRKRGKKQKASSSSESEEDDENWGKVATNWKKDGHPRRSSRPKRNVTYNCNESDDDFQHVPTSKKARVEVEVGHSQQGPKGLDTDRNLADLAKNAIRMKFNLQTTTVSAVDEAQAANRTWLEGGKGPEKENECLASQESKDGVSMESCSIPDAEFHNFDRGREEKDVEVGQVWALYDDKDGMPKYYMKVKEVHSCASFEVSVGWFEMRKPSEDLCELLDKGFSFTCGEFRLSSSQVIHSVNAFSHLVEWDKAGKGIVKIYPKKGQIWCIYEDWKCGQRLFTVSDIPSKHCMVEVLTDCNESSGVTVMPLKKVEGFKLLFKSSEAHVLRISFLELLRFSHQVPAYKLKGDEAPNVPKHCWELDPAAVPSSLIRTDATISCD